MVPDLLARQQTIETVFQVKGLADEETGSSSGVPDNDWSEPLWYGGDTRRKFKGGLLSRGLIHLKWTSEAYYVARKKKAAEDAGGFRREEKTLRRN